MGSTTASALISTSCDIASRSSQTPAVRPGKRRRWFGIRTSDIRLTLHTYTHVELYDQTAAIRALPGPGGLHSTKDNVIKLLG